jgi:hypothetical protein
VTVGRVNFQAGEDLFFKKLVLFRNFAWASFVETTSGDTKQVGKKGFTDPRYFGLNKNC